MRASNGPSPGIALTIILSFSERCPRRRPTTVMTHIAMQEALDGTHVTWLEYVTDVQYGAAVKSPKEPFLERSNTKQSLGSAQSISPLGSRQQGTFLQILLGRLLQTGDEIGARSGIGQTRIGHAIRGHERLRI